MHSDLYLGIDLGTSGVRAIAINSDGQVQAEARSPLPEPQRSGAKSEQPVQHWWDAVVNTLISVLEQITPGSVKSLAVDGTSGTLLLTNNNGEPLGPALMYNDGRSTSEARRIAAVAPRESAAHGATAALAKLLHLNPGPEAVHALHQADWIVSRLTGRLGVSDTNNCLKLGYDAMHQCWPAWLDELGIRRSLLPEVVQPGTPIGTIKPDLATQLSLSPDTVVIAGTTDSTAAFIATGACEVGEAVTSLGSTLVLKVISDRPVFSPQHGVYSQPLGDLWLAGGGSNSGGAVLLHYFSAEQISEMTPKLQPERPTGLHYYPLISPGERFPVNDATLAPALTPRPQDDLTFFQAMLEGMAQIELQGYKMLAELGAPWPVSIRSAGGGSRNAGWGKIREQRLGIPLITATQQEAAYGSALLARNGFLSMKKTNA